MKKIVAGLLALVLLSGQGKAHADVIVATFSGQVNWVDDPSGGPFTNGIHPGSTFSATVTYDANASPRSTDGTSYAEYAFLSGSFRLGDREFGLDEWDGRNTSTVENNRNGKDEVRLDGTLHPAVSAPGSHVQLSLLDSTQSAFSGLALPTSLDAGPFQRGDFFVTLKPADQPGAVDPASVGGSVNMGAPPFRPLRLPSRALSPC